MQTNLFENKYYDTFLYDLFQAYFDARKNKRNTINALSFETQFEDQIFKLYYKIIRRKYEPKPSICFVVNSPVKREIFAANFGDRIVHHYLYNCLSPIFETLFINDSYSCRKGKGIHYGIKRIDHFIRSCSSNYTSNCYILKLDIRSYFMSINRKILFKKLDLILKNKYKKYNLDLPLIIYLIKKTIFNDPKENCVIKGNKSDWIGLPKDKSLFFAKENCGLPIGNLTSQLFSNIYLNDFDHFIKKELRIKYYGRYVDDFVLMHQDKDYLLSLIPIIRDYLISNLKLELHPRKIYLQHFSKGVKYLGVVIKPYRIYIASRTKGNFYKIIQQQNMIIDKDKSDRRLQEKFQSSMNSYLGILKHYNTYKLRKKMLSKNLSSKWWKYTYLSGKYPSVKLKCNRIE